MDPNILIISDGIVHPSLFARYWFSRALPQTPGLRHDRRASLDAIQDLDLEQYAAIVCYFHHDHIAPQSLDLLEGYLQNGGGLFAVHSASASFKDEARYHDLLGGRFDHHGPIQDFEVFPTLDPDPIFPALEPFSVRDELYMHVYDPAVTVHFGTRSEGKVEPVVWTRHLGGGRVCYLALGHRGASFQVPAVQSIVAAGLVWVSQTAFPPEAA